MICDLYELKVMKDSTKNSSFVIMTELFCPAFNMAVNTGKATMDEWQKYAPAFYDFSDVLKKAEELYSFVNKKETK